MMAGKQIWLENLDDDFIQIFFSDSTMKKQQQSGRRMKKTK